MTDTVSAFRQVIERDGLTPPHAIIPDGKIHRFSSNGDRGDDSGWYILYSDAPSVAVYGDWRTGLKQTWTTKADSTLTAAERDRQRRRLDEARRQREQDERLRHAEAAKRAQTIWGQAASAPEDHPYLQLKGIQPHGLRVDDENRLIVPVTIDGALSSLQFIDASDGKLFLPGGAVKGGTFTLGALSHPDRLVLCEGFATGASLHEATGSPTICAFSAGNLLPVAHTIRQQGPSAVIVLAGDNDIRDDGKPNVGLDAATAAAKAIGGVLAMPDASNGEPTDWNDVVHAKGFDAVKDAIDAALKREQETEAMTKTTATME